MAESIRYQYRITKYNPIFRDEKGRYILKEWTSFSDVGKVVSFKEYIRVEIAYIETAQAFLWEANVMELEVRGLENSKKLSLSISDGKQLSLQEMKSIFRKILREEIWCSFESKSAFVHFGWDYYMYIGVSSYCPQSLPLAKKFGLFVEEFQSPYKKSA